MCADLSDKECLSTLDSLVQGMDDTKRLSFERAFGVSDCDSLSDEDCLVALDSERTAANDKTRLSLLKQACSTVFGSSAGGDAPPAIKFTSTSISQEDATCGLCNGVANEQCLIQLDAYVADLSDKDRLTFEKLYAEDQCNSLTDKECLATLDTMRATAKSTERLEMLDTACVSAGLTTSPDDHEETPAEANLDALDTSRCSQCVNLSNEQCLVTLDDYVNALADRARLAFELHFAEVDDCDPTGSTTDCLVALDAKRTSAEDPARLDLLLTSCSAEGHSIKGALSEVNGVEQNREAENEGDCLLCGKTEESSPVEHNEEYALQSKHNVPGANGAGIKPRDSSDNSPSNLAASQQQGRSSTVPWAVLAPVALVVLAVGAVVRYRRSTSYKRIPDLSAFDDLSV